METYSPNYLDYLIELNVVHIDFLRQIRHWNNLKIAKDAGTVWIKNFTENQISSIELKSIPFATHYYSKENYIYLQGTALPLKKMPNLLWTPIDKAIKIELPEFNHNYFGIQEKINMQLTPSETEEKTSVLLVDNSLANKYITEAAAIRLQYLNWICVNKNQSLIIGEPLLPLTGKAFWQSKNYIFPVGYTLEFPVLAESFNQQINPNNDHYIWYYNIDHYCLVEKNKFSPLSIYSWRQTLNIQ